MKDERKTLKYEKLPSSSIVATGPQTVHFCLFVSIQVAKINKDVTQKQKECSDDLAKAEPALLRAAEALDTLNKTNLTELKTFGQPPPAVSNVAAAVMVLTAPPNKIPRDRSWKNAKLNMGKVSS